jgi:hypothetical protein
VVCAAALDVLHLGREDGPRLGTGAQVALGVVADLEAGVVEFADFVPGGVEAFVLQEAEAFGDVERGPEAEALQGRCHVRMIGLVAIVER